MYVVFACWTLRLYPGSVGKSTTEVGEGSVSICTEHLSSLDKTNSRFSTSSKIQCIHHILFSSDIFLSSKYRKKYMPQLCRKFIQALKGDLFMKETSKGKLGCKHQF